MPELSARAQRVVELITTSFSQILIPGLEITIPLTLISFALGLIIALFTALVQVAGVRVLRQLARFYVWVFRGTPMLVQLYIVFYGLPKLGLVMDALPAAVIVFSLNTGAYASETIRAAIEAVPAGQMEAGLCVGMSYMQIMRRIVLPQALRTAFPPLSNSLIGLVKDTSLAANITVVEMFQATQRIAARTMEPFILYCEVGVIYLLFCTVLTRVQRMCEKKMEKRGRSA
ncbi:MAG: amino acid ABC transporter permease [Clostridiales bacterium]|nr:amino acid ABC transporter permease [Clostridiales bacterium]